jgi:hypothetical protein
MLGPPLPFACLPLPIYKAETRLAILKHHYSSCTLATPQESRARQGHGVGALPLTPAPGGARRLSARLPGDRAPAPVGSAAAGVPAQLQLPPP